MQFGTVLIGGPTATGKTAVAERICSMADGEIVSCDSRTVFRKLDIGTGKVFNSPDTVYHLVDLIEPGENFPVLDFVMLARRIMDDIRKRGRLPVVCGGSHHRLEMTVKGLDPSPPPEPEKRERYRLMEKNMGTGFLHGVLSLYDPDLAGKVHPNNLERTLRYLERAGSKPFERGISPLEGENPVFFLHIDMKHLKRRIENRCDRMLERGWVEEVRILLDGDLTVEKEGMDSTGYPRIAELIEGRITEEECRKLIIRDTLLLARQQMKWMKRLPRVVPIDMDRYDTEEAAGMVLERVQLE